jgi:hypothetical protein
MVYIPKPLREEVFARAHDCCEYCLTWLEIVLEMEVDHIIPVVAGGETVLDNLCLACISCNSHKRDAQSAIDPETGEQTPLFNPRQQNWHDHFQWDDAFTHVIGLTPIGRATISQLNMNRDLVVKARVRWVKSGWTP